MRYFRNPKLLFPGQFSKPDEAYLTALSDAYTAVFKLVDFMREHGYGSDARADSFEACAEEILAHTEDAINSLTEEAGSLEIYGAEAGLSLEEELASFWRGVSERGPSYLPLSQEQKAEAIRAMFLRHGMDASSVPDAQLFKAAEDAYLHLYAIRERLARSYEAKKPKRP